MGMGPKEQKHSNKYWTGQVEWDLPKIAGFGNLLRSFLKHGCRLLGDWNPGRKR